MGKSDRGIWCKVYYLFDVDGNMLRGIKTTYDPNVRDFFVGQPVWVVYTENKLKCHSLWPPIT